MKQAKDTYEEENLEEGLKNITSGSCHKQKGKKSGETTIKNRRTHLCHGFDNSFISEVADYIKIILMSPTCFQLMK